MVVTARGKGKMLTCERDWIYHRFWPKFSRSMDPISEIPKAYEPAAVEAKWQGAWLEAGCFTADPKRVSPAHPAFSIVIPPPNITGVLTLGHVLNNTIQDILARRARQTGHEVLWLPGTDHAGLATQSAVEKALRKDEKKTRHDLGREEFLRRTWEWREKHGNIIIDQFKKLGCSCDWSRQRFTLDADYTAAVQRVFVDLYAKGYIYRGKRMVNWDPAALTALSDEEVDSPRAEECALLREVRGGRSSRGVFWKWPRPARKRSWRTSLWP